MVCLFWLIGITTKRYKEIALGAFNNYVDRILPFFDPNPPPCVDSFYTLSGDKNRHFLTPPPHLVHVVIECPLSIYFYLNFTLRKREKKKNDLLRWNNAFNQSEIIQNFVPVRPGQKKTIAHPSHRFEESR